MKFVYKLFWLFIFSVFSSFLMAADYKVGRHFLDLGQAHQINKDKIIVEEIFTFVCPHCNNLHPHVKKFIKNMPQDVDLKYVPAAFTSNHHWNDFARIYYALTLVEKDRQKQEEFVDAMYNALHVDRKDPRRDGHLKSLLDAHGYDFNKFKKAMSSLVADSKVRESANIMQKYQVAGTPTIVVNGRYVVTPRLVPRTPIGHQAEFMKIVSFLVDRSRSERG